MKGPMISAGSNLVRCRIVSFLGAIAALVLLPGLTAAQTITFAGEALRSLPKEFEHGLAGEGGPGRWEVVQDNTGAGGRALAQLSSNPAANRFLVAIYKPIEAVNVEVTTRFKPLAGRTDQAGGVIVRAVDAGNYYIARANALENNVRFYRVARGQRQQLATADNVKVSAREWHTLTLRAEGDWFTVIFDGKQMHTTTDTTTAPKPERGKVGVWTKSDSVTHFDRIEIKLLP